MLPMPEMRDLIPHAIFEFRMQIKVGAIREDGIHDGRRHRHIPILGGTAEGPRLLGTIEPGGSDQQTIRLCDGLAFIDARYVIRHDDGTRIGIHNVGLRRGPPDVMARLATGERVDPRTYYFRTTLTFEVPDGSHDWLTHHVFVGVGARGPEGVQIDVYRIS